MSRRPRRRLAPAAIAGALLLAGCGTSGGSGAASTPGGSAAIGGTVSVYAAASLKEAFTRIAADFEKAHPGTTVVLNFGPSSGLATQITQGAPADVFASASPTNMDQVLKSGDATTSTPFVANMLEVAVPAANPAHITSLSDLGRQGVQVAECQPQVPCGVVATTVLAKAGVRLTAPSEETDVKAVLTKVILGEVDAGLVYVTDVRAAGSQVIGIPIPRDLNTMTEYPIATLTHAPNPTGAAAFTAYVLSAPARAVLTSDGFAAP